MTNSYFLLSIAYYSEVIINIQNIIKEMPIRYIYISYSINLLRS